MIKYIRLDIDLLQKKMGECFYFLWRESSFMKQIKIDSQLLIAFKLLKHRLLERLHSKKLPLKKVSQVIFSKLRKRTLVIELETGVLRCSVKKAFWKISWNSWENTYAGVSLALQLYEKETPSSIGVFVWILRNFKSTFIEHLRTTASIDCKYFQNGECVALCK